MSKIRILTKRTFIWVLRVLAVLLGFFIFWPVYSSLALVSWTKIVSIGASELSFTTVGTTTLGDTVRYVYLVPASASITIFGFPFGFDTGLLAILVFFALLSFTWWVLYGGGSV